MSWRALIAPEVRAFMEVHADHDVRALALMRAPDFPCPYAVILDQIKTRQKARLKTPFFCEYERFVFPPSFVFEQASSEPCARYKASLFKGDSFVDLTGGCGVDAFFLARAFSHGVVVEKDTETAEILAHNADILDIGVTVVQEDAARYVVQTGCSDLVYIDPQRRDDRRKGKVSLRDCSPDIFTLLPVLADKARRILIKTSPFLDIDQTILSLGCVCDVFVVQWNGDCKEVLYVLDPQQKTDLGQCRITAVDLDDCGDVAYSITFTRDEERDAAVSYGMPDAYIYEAGPAFQKAGAFNILAARWGVKKLHPHTHLYTAGEKVAGFPGRIYDLVNVVAPKAKNLDFSSADIGLRNYPGSVAALRKKLKLSDGGVHRVYGVTLFDGEKRLLVCRK